MKLLLALMFFLAGCAGESIHGYQWVHDESLPHCDNMAWVQVSQEAMEGLCSSNGQGADPRVIACASRCVVFSPLGKDEAKHYDEFGESLYDHEARHVIGRMSHP